jgi:hypothetical protein
VLNRFEYLSMYFVTGCADDKVAFPPLHHSFLSAVELLYYNIASRNEKSYDHYYYHTVELYKKWNRRMKSFRKREESLLNRIGLTGRPPKIT